MMQGFLWILYEADIRFAQANRLACIFRSSSYGIKHEPTECTPKKWHGEIEGKIRQLLASHMDRTDDHSPKGYGRIQIAARNAPNGDGRGNDGETNREAKKLVPTMSLCARNVQNDEA